MVRPEDITLCTPDNEKSCFACCPPIRPKDYEHVQYRNTIKRMLRDNTRAFDPAENGAKPITGFSCWALGYLDKDFKTIGCLLHPARHDGRDLRYRTGYGEKCRRESCPQSITFLGLSKKARQFFLGLTTQLDSFDYSSKNYNPLFRLLGWGSKILEKVSQESRTNVLDRETFFRRYPVLVSPQDPRPIKYMMECIVDNLGVDILRSEQFSLMFQDFFKNTVQELSDLALRGGATFTHQLGMGEAFQDMLRLAVGIKRIDRDQALRLKEKVDQDLANFVRTIG